MTVAVAASLAAIAVVSAIGTVVSSTCSPSLIDALGTVPRSHRRSSTLEAIGTLPALRSIRLSERTAHRLQISRQPWGARAVVGAKSVSASLTAAATLVAGPLAAAAAGVVAWHAPDLVIARLARRRIAAVDRDLPALLDFIAIATSAGLPPQLALRRAVEAASGPLADELGSVVNATDLGGRWRDELATVGERSDLPDVRRLVGALTRSNALGSSLSEEIGRLAGDVREVRRAAAAERARTAPVKMLFPLVFLVLPAFLLLTVVPVLLTTVRSIS